MNLIYTPAEYFRWIMAPYPNYQNRVMTINKLPNS